MSLEKKSSWGCHISRIRWFLALVSYELPLTAPNVITELWIKNLLRNFSIKYRFLHVVSYITKLCLVEITGNHVLSTFVRYTQWNPGMILVSAIRKIQQLQIKIRGKNNILYIQKKEAYNMEWPQIASREAECNPRLLYIDSKNQKSLNVNPKTQKKKKKTCNISQGILIIQQNWWSNNNLGKRFVVNKVFHLSKKFLHCKMSFVRVNLTPPIYRTLGCVDDII